MSVRTWGLMCFFVGCQAIVTVEEELQQHLKDVRKEFKRPGLAYATVSGIEV